MEEVHVAVVYTYQWEELESLNSIIYIAGAGSDSCLYHSTGKIPTQILMRLHTFIAQRMHM